MPVYSHTRLLFCLSAQMDTGVEGVFNPLHNTHECVECHSRLPREQFSRCQLHKPKSKRKCISCCTAKQAESEEGPGASSSSSSSSTTAAAAAASSSAVTDVTYLSDEEVQRLITCGLDKASLRFPENEKLHQFVKSVTQNFRKKIEEVENANPGADKWTQLKQMLENYKGTVRPELFSLSKKFVASCKYKRDTMRVISSVTMSPECGVLLSYLHSRCVSGSGVVHATRLRNELNVPAYELISSCFWSDIMNYDHGSGRSPFHMLMSLLSKIETYEKCCTDALFASDGCLVRTFTAPRGVLFLNCCISHEVRKEVTIGMLDAYHHFMMHVWGHYRHLYEKAPRWAIEMLASLSQKTVVEVTRMERENRQLEMQAQRAAAAKQTQTA
jgi:hypothetical protein